MSAVFDPHDLDPGGSHEASDTFEWFVGRVEASDPDALDLKTLANILKHRLFINGYVVQTRHKVGGKQHPRFQLFILEHFRMFFS